MNRKLMAAVIAAVIIVLNISACMKEEQVTFTGETAQEPEYQINLNAINPSAYSKVEGLNLEPGTYISIIGKAEEPAYWRAVRRGVMQAADDLNDALGYTGDEKIKVTYNGASKTEDIDEQVNILDEELSRYPDVIGIASVDEEACTVQFDLATENGIPIIAFDSGNKYQGIQCTVKTDNVEASRTGAHKMMGEINGEGEVLVLAHDSKSETAKERAESFQEEITANESGVSVAEIVYCDQLDEIKKKIAEEQDAQKEEEEAETEWRSFSDADAIQYKMEEYPGLRGIFGTSIYATQLGLEAIRQTEAAESPVGGTKDTDGEESTESGNKAADSEEGTESEEEKAEDTEAESAGTEQGKTEISGTKNGGISEEAGDGETEGLRAEGEGNGSETEGAENVEKEENETGGTENKETEEVSSENGDIEGIDQSGESEKEKTEEEEKQGNREPIVLMGFDAGKEQMEALEAGEIAGLVVQNPFGIGYASVIAAARTVLEAGNEAEVNTGYIWVTKENLTEESIQRMLYE